MTMELLWGNAFCIHDVSINFCYGLFALPYFHMRILIKDLHKWKDKYSHCSFLLYFLLFLSNNKQYTAAQLFCSLSVWPSLNLWYYLSSHRVLNIEGWQILILDCGVCQCILQQHFGWCSILPALKMLHRVFLWAWSEWNIKWKVWTLTRFFYITICFDLNFN